MGLLLVCHARIANLRTILSSLLPQGLPLPLLSFSFAPRHTGSFHCIRKRGGWLGGCCLLNLAFVRYD